MKFKIAVLILLSVVMSVNANINTGREENSSQAFNILSPKSQNLLVDFCEVYNEYVVLQKLMDIYPAPANKVYGESDQGEFPLSYQTVPVLVSQIV
ncbi:MAG: hypothetical protein KBD63_06245, partial [Bacteriovoracaceae bacterium]|nr:hypothetical protein [Bacteriovoracaceae bacterium]